MIILSSGIGRALHSDVSCHRQLGVYFLLCCLVVCTVKLLILCRLVKLHLFFISCSQFTLYDVMWSGYTFYDVMWTNCTFCHVMLMNYTCCDVMWCALTFGIYMFWFHVFVLIPDVSTLFYHYCTQWTNCVRIVLFHSPNMWTPVKG